MRDSLRNSNLIETQLQDMNVRYFALNDLIKNMYTKQHDAKWFATMRASATETVELFEDDLSKAIYVKAICDRIAPHLDTKPFSKYQTEPEYFQMEFWHLGENEGFLDVGAYTGDTIIQFCESVQGKYNFFYGFEMEKEPFQEMKDNLQGKLNGRNRIFNVGISNTNAESQRFRSLDSFEYPGKVTLVKMDVEGMENKCLRGGDMLIRKDEPKLAVCVYHRLEDLWEIPRLVKRMNPRYKLWLRHHAPCVWDTVLYANV